MNAQRPPDIEATGWGYYDVRCRCGAWLRDVWVIEHEMSMATDFLYGECWRHGYVWAKSWVCYP
jgi:hypothetical protein